MCVGEAALQRFEGAVPPDPRESHNSKVEVCPPFAAQRLSFLEDSRALCHTIAIVAVT